MILTIPYCNLATRPLVSLDIAWKDGQRNDVARNLKRLRKQMSKKWGDQSSAGEARPQFLADADVDVDFTGLNSKASLKEMKRAQSRMFGGKQKSKCGQSVQQITQSFPRQ